MSARVSDIKFDFGLRLNDSSGDWIVVKVDNENQILDLSEIHSEKRKFLQVHKVQSMIATGEMVVPMLREAISKQPIEVSQIHQTTEKSEQEYQARLRLVHEFNRLAGEGMPRMQAYEEVLLSDIAKEVGPVLHGLSSRTLQSWCRAFAEHGAKGLVPKHSFKGRTVSEVNAEIDLFVMEVLYLLSTEARFTLDYLRLRAMQLIQGRTQLHINVSIDRVRNCIIRLPWVIRHANKFDSKLQRAIRSFATARYDIRQPYQRLEIDYTRLPLFAICHRTGLIVRPWAVIVIDCGTGFPLAVLIRISPPNSIDALDAVQRAMHGYSLEEFEAMDIKNRIYYRGTPEKVVSDQGSEFKSEQFMEIRSIGIDVEACAPYSPFRKPFVETAAKTLKSHLANLQGSVRNVRNLGTPEIERAQKQACYTLEEVQTFVTRFIFDVYARIALTRHVMHCLAINDTDGVTPGDRLVNLTRRYPPSLPIPFEQVRRARLKKEKRRLQTYGIEVGGMKFSSNDLRELYHFFGRGEMVEILYDPIDVREIIVIDPTTNKEVAAKNTLDIDMSMTFETAKLSMAKLVREGQQVSKESLLMAWYDTVEKIAETKNKGKTPYKQGLYLSSEAEKIERAQENPSLSPKDVEDAGVEMFQPRVDPFDILSIGSAPTS